MDAQELVRQVGRMNVLAVSGGRVQCVRDASGDTTAVVFPVAAGYRVRVTLDGGADLYDVERVFVRGGREFSKGMVRGVYCDEVGEVVYQASCFRSNTFGGVAAGGMGR